MPTIIAVSEHSAEVSAYSEDVGKLFKVPIVDAVLTHECPRSQSQCLLVLRNALYVPSMKHHLIPPFIMREAGVTVKWKVLGQWVEILWAAVLL